MSEITHEPMHALVVDYIRRMPATAGNVASHFCMSMNEARSILSVLQGGGHIERGLYGTFRLVSAPPDRYQAGGG